MAFGSVATSTDTRNKIGLCDWNDPDAVAKCVNAVWEGRNTAQKSRAEQQAYRNLAFISGDQWHKWSKSQNRMAADDRDILGTGPKPDWEQRLTYDMISGIIEMRSAKLDRVDVTVDTTPVSTDPEDVQKAKASNDVMKYVFSSLEMNALIAKWRYWADTTKCAFLDVGWDKNKGDKKTVTPDTFLGSEDAPPLGGDVDPMAWAQEKMGSLYGDDAAANEVWQGHSGWPTVDVVPLFEMNVWPFDCNEFSQARIWVRTMAMTVAEAAEQLGKTADEVRSYGKTKGADEFYRGRVTTGGGRDSGSFVTAGGDDEDNDSVLVHKAFHVACADYPNGRMAYVVGQTCVEGTLIDNPYMDEFSKATIPFVPLHGRWTPNMLWGRCVTDSLIDPQKDFNLAASQKSNWRNYAIMPTLVRMKNDNMVGRPSTAPNGVLEINSMDEMPKFLDRPGLRGEHDQDMDRNATLMHEISAVGTVDTGGAASTSAESGRAVLARQEQNDMRMVPFTKRANHAVGQAGTLLLCMLQDFLSDEMTVSIVGEDNKMDAMTFSGQSLRPKAGTGGRRAMVKCEAYNQLPSTREQMRATVDTLIERKVFQPDINPEDKSEVLRLYSIGKENAIEDKRRKHIAKQNGEVDKWRRGELVGPPDKHDRHMIHRPIVEDWLNTDEAKQLLATNPALANDVTNHLELHRRGEAYDLAKPQYDMLLANVQAWAEARNSLAQIDPGLVDLFLPVPMGMAAPVPPGGGNEADGTNQQPQENSGPQPQNSA